MFGLILFGMMMVGIILRGWALSTLWAWFLVPIGAVAINIPTALGISVIVGLFTTHLNNEKVKTGDKRTIADLTATIVAKSIGGPLVSVLIGWIITLFM
jgi:hypothetical protein